jgi:hypothetical protein
VREGIERIGNKGKSGMEKRRRGGGNISKKEMKEHLYVWLMMDELNKNLHIYLN